MRTLKPVAFAAVLALGIGAARMLNAQTSPAGLWNTISDVDGKPMAVVQADNDEYGDRGEIETFFAGLPDPKRLWIVEQATHLFPGRLDALESAAGEAIDWLAGYPPTSAASG